MQQTQTLNTALRESSEALDQLALALAAWVAREEERTRTRLETATRIQAIRETLAEVSR